MGLALIISFAVGLATVIGSLMGLIFKNISHKFGNAVISFAAGVMLAAAVFGLILPSLENGGKFAVLITVTGFFSGAFCLNLLARLTPLFEKRLCADMNIECKDKNIEKVLLFVTAIAIHNLPEGIAAGVGVGAGNISEAVMIASGIALQNIPEGMVTVCPMLAAGISLKKTVCFAVFTGAVEVIGGMVGYIAVTAAKTILPFALSFAGGTMFYVIGDEMIPDTHKDGSDKVSSYALMIGFCLMMMSDVLMG